MSGPRVQGQVLWSQRTSRRTTRRQSPRLWPAAPRRRRAVRPPRLEAAAPTACGRERRVRPPRRRIQDHSMTQRTWTSTRRQPPRPAAPRRAAAAALCGRMRRGTRPPHRVAVIVAVAAALVWRTQSAGASRQAARIAGQIAEEIGYQEQGIRRDVPNIFIQDSGSDSGLTQWSTVTAVQTQNHQTSATAGQTVKARSSSRWSPVARRPERSPLAQVGMPLNLWGPGLRR